MITFDEIKTRLRRRTHDFDIFTQYITEPALLTQLQHITRPISPRYYLSAWVLYHFPDISMNKNIDDHLYNLSKRVVDADKPGLLHVLPEFKKAFEEWKTRDYNILAESICMQYHNSGVDLLNADNADDKEIIKEIRNGLLDTANKIGGKDLCDEIVSVRPVVVDIRELGKQFDNAFWDSLKEGYDTGDYRLFLEVITHIKEICKMVSPTKIDYINDILDTEYISKIVESKSRDEYILALIMNILDFIQQHQAPIRDIRLKGVRDMIGIEEKRIDILKGIVNLVEQIVIDINNNNNNNK